jgi:glycosyltransferase involved in cell wall biosynthesis
VSAQSLGDFEVIVVDDGSTDGGGDLARAHGDPRLRVVRQDNRGEGGARNRGVAESSGGLVAMLDADDEWDPSFLATVLGLWQRFPEAGLVATGYRSRFAGGFTLETGVPGCDEGCLVGDYFEKAARAAVVWSSAQAIPRSVYERVGPFGADPIGIDTDMWGRIALRHSLACSSRILATYHSDVPDRMLLRHQREAVFPPFVRYAREAMARGEVDESGPPGLGRYLNTLLLQYVHRVVAAGDRPELRRTLREEFSPEHGWAGTLGALRVASAVLPLGVLAAALRVRGSRWGWRVGLVGDRELERRAS